MQHGLWPPGPRTAGQCVPKVVMAPGCWWLSAPGRVAWTGKYEHDSLYGHKAGIKALKLLPCHGMLLTGGEPGTQQAACCWIADGWGGCQQQQQQLVVVDAVCCRWRSCRSLCSQQPVMSPHWPVQQSCPHNVLPFGRTLLEFCRLAQGRPAPASGAHPPGSLDRHRAALGPSAAACPSPSASRPHGGTVRSGLVGTCRRGQLAGAPLLCYPRPPPHDALAALEICCLAAQSSAAAVELLQHDRIRSPASVASVASDRVLAGR